jgi:hypothetical protein
MDYAIDAIYITGMVVRDTNTASPQKKQLTDRTPFGLFIPTINNIIFYRYKDKE